MSGDARPSREPRLLTRAALLFLVLVCAVSSLAMAPFDGESDDAQLLARTRHRDHGAEAPEPEEENDDDGPFDADDDDTQFNEEMQRRGAAQASTPDEDDAQFEEEMMARRDRAAQERASIRDKDAQYEEEMERRGQAALAHGSLGDGDGDAAQLMLEEANDEGDDLLLQKEEMRRRREKEEIRRRREAHESDFPDDAGLAAMEKVRSDGEVAVHREKRSAAAAARHEQEGHEVLVCEVRRSRRNTEGGPGASGGTGCFA